MKKILNFNQYKMYENVDTTYIVELGWDIGDGKYKFNTYYITDYDQKQMNTFLEAVEDCDSKYILGNKYENIQQNDIDLPEDQLKMYIEMAEDLMSSSIDGECASMVEAGIFSLEKFKIKLKK